MVASAAVINLLEILDSMLDPTIRGRRICHNRAQMKSLHEKVSFLLDFLENPSSRQDFEIESLETKIRDAACKAKYVIESNISDQLLAEIDTVTSLFLLVNISGLMYLIFDFRVLVAFMRLFLISIQFVLPLRFQNVVLVMFRVLIPLTVHLLLLSLILKMTAAGYVVYKVVLEESYFVKYVFYASQPENQDLLPAIDEFHSLIKEVVTIKDARGSGPDRESQRADSADDLSRWDFRGIGKNVVVGLDGDLQDLYDRLLGYSSELEIVPIVGMGGIGKTTLARQVHDDPHIVYHFDICAWVTVSQEYSLLNVMLGLLDSAKIPAKEILKNHIDDDWNQKLGEHLYKNLMSRRYLIVMDDVWDTGVWDFVRLYFPDNNNGSRVLLTTRLSEVASYANSGSPPHPMRFLDEGDSWHLLCEKVFGGEDCPPELEPIGRMISLNCGGLPLAIVVVGGLLYNEPRTVQDWTHVSNNLNSILSKDDEQCLEILGLSYKHLPRRLKPCFLYMGVFPFPDNKEINVTKLFNLWGAEGFLGASKSKSLEEVAEEYLKDLIERSLVLVGKWSCSGKIKTCKVHGLLRDICRINARKENFLDFANWDGYKNRPTLDTLVFEDDNASYEPRSRYFMARSLRYVGGCFSHRQGPFYLAFRLVRVLDIATITLHEFPNEILELFHLRYLGLKLYNQLPPSISRLWNLQTVVVYNEGFMGLRIPVEIWSMPNLRHLYFWGGFLPDPPMWELLWNPGLVKNLETLVGILDFRCTKGILKNAPNLKKLVFSNYGYMDGAEYELESLVNLHQLETLKITVEYRLFTSPPKLAFPQKLRRLTLCGCVLPWETMRVVGALPNLRVLKLKDTANLGGIWEPVEGDFCQLVFLLLEDVDLVHWRANEAHFPRLQRLILRRLYKLEEIPCGIGEIPTLESIELDDCLPSAMASAKQIQEEQQSMGNEGLKIHIEISVGLHMKWRTHSVDLNSEEGISQISNYKQGK